MRSIVLVLFALLAAGCADHEPEVPAADAGAGDGGSWIPTPKPGQGMTAICDWTTGGTEAIEITDADGGIVEVVEAPGGEVMDGPCSPEVGWD